MASASLINSYLPTPDVYLYNAGYVYPNPAREYIIVEYKVQESDLPAVIKVLDSKGSVVARLPVNDVEGQMLYETKGINSGLYCFTLVTKLNAVVSRKVSVVK